MITQVTMWVEHGETTDPLQQWIADAQDSAIVDYKAAVLDYDLVVDVPHPHSPVARAKRTTQAINDLLSPRGN